MPTIVAERSNGVAATPPQHHAHERTLKQQEVASAAAILQSLTPQSRPQLAGICSRQHNGGSMTFSAMKCQALSMALGESESLPALLGEQHKQYCDKQHLSRMCG